MASITDARPIRRARPGRLALVVSAQIALLSGCDLLDGLVPGIAACERPPAASALAVSISNVGYIQVVELSGRGPIPGRDTFVRVALTHGEPTEQPLRIPAKVAVVTTLDGVTLGVMAAGGPECVRPADGDAPFAATFNALLPA